MFGGSFTVFDQLATFPGIAHYLRNRQQDRDIYIPETICNHVVVAGYGRVGQVIVNVLRDRNYEVLVIENSEAATKHLRQEKIPYIFGDADAELVLEKAHLHTAKALAIALPDPGSTRILLKHALDLAPDIDIVARSHTDFEIDLLTQMGAKEVVQPEFEAALEMGRQILTTLGEAEPMVNFVLQAIRRDRYLSVRDDRARKMEN